MPTEYKFQSPTSENCNHPFPENISNNPRVLYHGTSNIFEKEIEENGLTPNKSIFSLEELKEISALFDLINWRKKVFWGKNIIRNYTINKDYKNPSLKPVYLGESCNRALTFASKEFAGGENVSGVRKSFNELKDCIDDPKLLDRELEFYRKECREAEENGYYPPEPIITDLDKLKNELESLEYLNERAKEYTKAYSYGVVFSIEIDPENFPDMSHSFSQGFKMYSTIRRNQILGKTRVPENYKVDFFAESTFWELPNYEGVVKKLAINSEP